MFTRDNVLVRLIVALVVAAVIVWLLPLDGFVVGLVALLAFLLILFGAGG